MSHEHVNALPVEARPHQGMRAGIVSRVVANTIDFTVLVIALVAIYLSWCAFRFLRNPPSFTFPAPSFIAILIAGGALLFLYFTASWATTGRTYGDYVMGLRVVNFRGDPMAWLGAMVRAAFCVALPIGLFWAVISNQNRSAQDVVLRTSVIYDWRLAERPSRPSPPGDPAK